MHQSGCSLLLGLRLSGHNPLPFPYRRSLVVAEVDHRVVVGVLQHCSVDITPTQPPLPPLHGSRCTPQDVSVRRLCHRPWFCNWCTTMILHTTMYNRKLYFVQLHYQQFRYQGFLYQGSNQTHLYSIHHYSHYCIIYLICFSFTCN